MLPFLATLTHAHFVAITHPAALPQTLKRGTASQNAGSNRDGLPHRAFSSEVATGLREENALTRISLRERHS